MYWRRFRVDSVPIDNPALFDRWLRDRWTEKDMLLSIYNRTGRFPADNGIYKGSDGKIRRGAGYIESEVKSVRWYEFLKIFAPVGLFAMVLYMFYGAIPKEVVPSTEKQVLGNTLTIMQKGLAEKSRRTGLALLNEPSSKISKEIFTAATRKPASSILDKHSSKVKTETSTPVTRKAAGVLPNKLNTKANTHDSTSTARKTAISVSSKSTTKANDDTSLSISRNTKSSLPDKTSSKAEIADSASSTRKIASSITSKSGSKTNPESSTKATQKTETLLPSNSTSKAKAENSVTATKKNPQKLGMPGAKSGKSKNENPAVGALATRKTSAHAAAQETVSGGHKPSMPTKQKVTAKNQLVKTPISNPPSKKYVTQAPTKLTPKPPQPQQAIKKVAPKLPAPKPQSQSDQKRVGFRPDGESTPKIPRSQNTKLKGAVKRPSNVAVSKK